MALTKISGSVIKDSVSLSGNVSVGGTLTYQDVTNVDALGIGTFRTGIKDLAGQVDIGSNIKIGNAGIITATELDISGDIDVDGHTNLDNVSIAGVTTTSGNIVIENAEPSLFLTDTNANPDYKIFNDQGAFKIYDTTYSATRLQIGPSNGEVTIASNTYFPNGITMNPGTASVVNTIAQKIGDTDTKIRFPAADTFSVETAGSERLRIDNSGTVYFRGSSSSDNHRLQIRVNDTDTEFRGSSNSTTNKGFAFYSSNTNASEKLRITSDGKVGINQSTWSGKDHMFEVRQSTNDKEIARFTVDGGDGSVQGKGFIGLSAFNSTTYPHAYIGVEEYGTSHYEGHLTFATRNASNDSAPTERLRINSSGQLIMTNAATQTFFDFSTTNNNTRGLFSIAGKDNSGNAVTVKIGGFGDTNRGEIFTHSNHSLGFATNNATAQVILHTSGLFDVVGECRATNFYLRGNGSAPTADASIFRPANNTLAFATASTERIRIENSGISGTIKNNYAVVAFITDRDDGSRSTGSTSYQDDTGLNLTNAITYKHGDILFVKANCPTGVALVSSNTANYQGVGVRIKLTPSSGTTRYSNETRGWYRNDGPATKETMQMSTTIYHLIASNTSEFSDNVTLSFQVQYKRDPGGTGSYGAVGLSNWSGERTLEVWQFRKQL